MADPISLAAIAGLIYAGRTLSNKKAQVSPVEMQRRIVEQTPNPPAIFDRIEPLPDMSNLYEPRVEIPHKKENDSFAVISAQHRTNGQEVLSMRDRMFDTGRMNNLSPIEKQLVGPGLGVGADVPASGGYQQLVRVNPINVGEHRLTTLPGRTGPAADVTGGRSAVIGQLTHNKPDTTTYLPSRLPTVMGRAQGMTGLIPRQEHEKTKRITNRSETGNRTDGLGFNGAKRFISAQTMSQDPTRFKSDRNDEQYMYNNRPAPVDRICQSPHTDTRADKPKKAHASEGCSHQRNRHTDPPPHRGFCLDDAADLFSDPVEITIIRDKGLFVELSWLHFSQQSGLCRVQCVQG